MTTPPPRTPADAVRIADMLAVIADDVRRSAHQLHRALVDAQPGYPTSSLGGGGRGGDVGRPTERYALEGDTSAADLAAWYQNLDYALRWLTEAWYVRSKHMVALSAVRLCANPAGCPQHRLAEPGRGGFCQPCWRAIRAQARAGEAA